MTDQIEQLIASLRSDDATERSAAAERLAQLGPECGDACAALARACGTDEATREWAASALEELGPPPTEQLAPLTQLLDDRSDDVVYWAAALLGRLAEEAASACAALAGVIGSSREPFARERAVWAAQQIGCSSPALAEALAAARNSGHARLARLAGEALDAQ